MGQPIVHFEISGKDPQKLRTYYRDLFGWYTSAPVAETVSQRGNYGFVNRDTTDDGIGIPGGIGERLRGTRVMGPVENPGKDLVVAHFTDPEGNLIGLAGPA